MTDHGVGIQQEAMAGIFEPFHTTGRSGAPSLPRLGSVGLSLAKRIVEAHGGRIEVESRAGAGTTFRVWLPLAPSREAERRATKAAGTPIGPLPVPGR